MLNVKIDTKEIFHVITPLNTSISANMSEELNKTIIKTQESENKSIVLNLGHVSEVEAPLLKSLAQLEMHFKGIQKSFVICNIREELKQNPSFSQQLTELNLAPTESEAWDIVQMEEIERELGSES
jgi:anti-anti-sigma regulatory factor